MYQPAPANVLSLPQRQRNWIFWPDAAGGRLAMVVMKPPESPVQEGWPARGLPYPVSIVALYPLETKTPPTAVKLVKAAAPILISSTPPSKVDSIANRWRNESGTALPGSDIGAE